MSKRPNWQDGALQGRRHWHAAQHNRERLVVRDRQRTLKDLHTQTLKSTSKIAVRDHRDISLRKTKQRPPRTWSSARTHIIWEPNSEGQGDTGILPGRRAHLQNPENNLSWRDVTQPLLQCRWPSIRVTPLTADFYIFREARRKARFHAISSAQIAVLNTPKEYFHQKAFWEAFRQCGWLDIF